MSMDRLIVQGKFELLPFLRITFITPSSLALYDLHTCKTPWSVFQDGSMNIHYPNISNSIVVGSL